MLQPIVYLPIEIKNRELEARLLTACYLLQRGVTVVLGQQWGVIANAEALPPGAILFKTMNQIQGSAMSTFNALGHLVIGSDEEVLTSVSEYLSSFAALSGEMCHLFLAQNEMHAAAVRDRFPRLASAIAVTGNARVEVMRQLGPEMFGAEAAAIKAQHGPLVLINTNYATANSIWGQENALAICIQAGVVDADNPASVEQFNAALAWEAQNQADMLALLTWMSANITSHRIVVRPHPAERPGYWDKFAVRHPNVTVVHKTHHVPWIMAADLVIHTSCTTGLETAFLGRPALNIERSVDPYSARITSLVNHTVQTPEAAIDAIEPFLRDGSGPLGNAHQYDDLLEKHYPGFTHGGTAELVAEQICAALRQHGAPLGQPVTWPSDNSYQRIVRSDVSKEKMSLGVEELSAAIQLVLRHVKRSAKFSIAKLDDSLFMLKPT